MSDFYKWQGCDRRELELSRAAFDINDIMVMGKKREMTKGAKRMRERQDCGW